MADFIVRDDAGFNSQLKNFKTKLPSYLEELSLTKEDLTEAAIISNFYDWVATNTVLQNERKLRWNSFKDMLRRPGAGQPPMSLPPDTLIVAAPPETAPLGAEDWLRRIAKRIKGSKNYTEAIGLDLGIVAPAAAKATQSKKPVFSIQLVAGQPLIVWKKDGMDGVEIWKDSGDGHFTLLLFDQRPNHLDTSELPAPGITAVWRYKLIYRLRDERAGEWSDPVSVTVTGTV